MLIWSREFSKWKKKFSYNFKRDNTADCTAPYRKLDIQSWYSFPRFVCTVLGPKLNCLFWILHLFIFCLFWEHGKVLLSCEYCRYQQTGGQTLYRFFRAFMLFILLAIPLASQRWGRTIHFHYIENPTVKFSFFIFHVCKRIPPWVLLNIYLRWFTSNKWVNSYSQIYILVLCTSRQLPSTCTS